MVAAIIPMVKGNQLVGWFVHEEEYVLPSRT